MFEAYTSLKYWTLERHGNVYIARDINGFSGSPSVTPEVAFESLERRMETRQRIVPSPNPSPRKNWVIPAGWDSSDLNAANMRDLARRTLLPLALQYELEPEDLKKLMLEIWEQYAWIKRQKVIRNPSGLMYVLMRKAAQKIPEMRPTEHTEEWEAIWHHGSVSNVTSPGS